jgi:hypothetical protein
LRGVWICKPNSVENVEELRTKLEFDLSALAEGKVLELDVSQFATPGELNVGLFLA